MEMGRTCACFNLRKAARSVTQLYDEILRPTGLRSTQLSLLAGTLVLQPVTLSRLARATGTDRTTLTRNLRILEFRGLIRIEPETDRRKRAVHLTEQGGEVLERARPLWLEAQARVVASFGGERFERLIGELAHMVKVLRRS